jgi:hypothetical protein
VSTLVVSQPMFLPWIGMFEQVRLADVFVHYDDVQLPQGRSFITRVQVRTAQGIHWLTVPVERSSRGLIRDVRMEAGRTWRERHLATLRHAYAKTPFFEEMFSLADRIYANGTRFLWEFNASALETIGAHLSLAPRYVVSSGLATPAHGTRKLVAIARAVGATRYVTGLGALDYLEYDLFEAAQVRVEYMQYRKVPYPQIHGEFTPYVTILDCIANCGAEARRYITSSSVYWKEYIAHERT